MAYDEYFKAASLKYGVDENLLKAVAKVESNFNPMAESSAGAVGIMQLMPGTAAGLGVTDRTDPQQSIDGGAKYLSQLLKAYDGDTEKALAAYNGGMGNVSKYGASKYAGYVEKVKAAYGGDFDESSTISTTDSSSSTSTDVDLKWWGDIVKVVFMALLIIGALLFLYVSLAGNPVEGIKKTVKKVTKGK